MLRSGKRQEQEDEAGGGFPKDVCFHFFSGGATQTFSFFIQV
jgi:hypothetical protein